MAKINDENQNIILVKDIGIEKTTNLRDKQEKVIDILNVVWGLISIALFISFYNSTSKSNNEGLLKASSDYADILLCIFTILLFSCVSAIFMMIPSLFFSIRWKLWNLWGKRIIKIIKYMIIFIPFYLVTGCIFSIGEMGEAFLK